MIYTISKMKDFVCSTWAYVKVCHFLFEPELLTHFLHT